MFEKRPLLISVSCYNINESGSPTLDNADDFLGAVGTNPADKTTWSVTVSSMLYNTRFKVDTGADVAVNTRIILRN